jgi:hypothetical protein
MQQPSRPSLLKQLAAFLLCGAMAQRLQASKQLAIVISSFLMMLNHSEFFVTQSIVQPLGVVTGKGFFRGGGIAFPCASGHIT